MNATRDAGFTLIELIVVTLIIGVLAAIAVPIFLSSLEQARTSALHAALANARLSVALVVVETSALPVGAQRAEILAAHGDADISLTLTGAGGDFCISGQHALVGDTWAGTQRDVPVRGASCAADGSLIVP